MNDNVYALKVYLEISNRKINQEYTYLVNEKQYQQITLGTTVEVEFSKQIRSGYVTKKMEINPQNYPYQLKPIVRIHENQQLNSLQQNFINWFITNYAMTFNEALNIVFPKKHRQVKRQKQKILNLKEQKLVVYKRTDTKIIEERLQELNQLFQIQQYYKRIDLLKSCQNINDYQLNKAIKLAYIEKVEIKQSEYEKTYVEYNEKVLTKEQQDVIETIITSETNNFLLFGEMGSGKTEIFIKLFSSLKDNEQMLIIEPNGLLKDEIAKRLMKVFPNQVLNYDYYATSEKVYNDNLAITSGRYRIVIGYHQALFNNWDNLKYVVADEAHAFNYQNQEPEYNFFDVMRFYQEQNPLKFIAASATPSVEMYARSTRGYYQLLTLPNAYYNQDVTIEYQKLNDYQLPLSPASLIAIKDTLASGNKVIILHNLRGYASALECNSCKRVPKCPNCQSPLNYYVENQEKLRCHHCNFQVGFRNFCSRCQKKGSYQPIGVGIEQVQKQLKQYFAGTKIHVVDADVNVTTRRKILAEFNEKKAQILLGTPIISLGIDISDVTLAIVTNVDYGLINQSVEAEEETFQLLTQFKGRIGRRGEKSKLLVQTKYPEHYIFTKYLTINYAEYLPLELQNRYLLRNYPFVNYAKIEILAINYNDLKKHCQLIIETIAGKMIKEYEILEPKRKKRYRNEFYYQCQIIITYQKEDISQIISVIKFSEQFPNNIIKFNPHFRR